MGAAVGTGVGEGDGADEGLALGADCCRVNVTVNSPWVEPPYVGTAFTACVPSAILPLHEL